MEKKMSDAWTSFKKILFIERKASWRIHMVRWETYKETNHLSSRKWVARYVEAYVWCSKKESKTKMDYRETKARQCQTIERNILHWIKRRRKQAHKESRWKKVGRSDASSNAWQNTDREQWRNPPQYWETQDKIRLFCWCRRKHETKARWSWTQTSSRSHHCRRDEFNNSLQSCSQVHSDASSMKKKDAKAAVEKEWGKTEENPSVQLTKVRNKKEAMKQRSKGRRIHFASLMDLCHLKNSELTSVTKIQRSSCTPRWYCER